MLGSKRAREAFVAVGVIGMAAVVGYQTAVIPVAPVYSRIGPTIFPVMVTAGLALLGIILLWQAISGGWATEEDAEQLPIDWPALGWLGLGLLLNVALIKPLGFIIASILMFCCVARAFGSRRLMRDAAVAAVLSVIAYVGFAHLLGISIGAGILEGLI